ncbi:MAG: MucR family transcriptional regulator [Syntrophobacteraceae bacterium]
MSKKLIEIASEIVQTQVSQNHMSSTEIATSLRQVFSTLHELQQAEAGEMELPNTFEPAPAKAVKPEDSIQDDKVICLECGSEMRQLTKLHLVSHGMTAKEYKKKYGFTLGTPLAAKSLTKARSKAAKKRGVPENLKKYMEARRQSKAESSGLTAAETAEQPKRTRIRKKKAE